ncbi:helix-turn-helix domain-containing protein [Halovivax gelatinilyticus]|uniref:helix-turn-helix domain-containing protein n=1 Tax=Halovivax gelatinilyticus TaxID=2961597 RepID=UPI0020CA3F3C|nr:helix-turn-helix domain-containing protein [Halovivax gelatinilyticus]
MEFEKTGTSLPVIVCNHAEILSILNDDGVQYKRELAEKLDVSKSTIYNRNRKLSRYKLMRKERGGYVLTELGSMCYSTYKKFEGELHLVYSKHR